MRMSDFFIFEIGSIELMAGGGGSSISPRNVEELTKRDFKTYPESGFYENYTMIGASNGGAVYHDNIIRHLKNKKIDKGVIINAISNSLGKATDKNYNEDLLKLMDLYHLKAIYTNHYTNTTVPKQYSYWELKEKGFIVSAQTSTMDSLLSQKVNINMKPALTPEGAGYAVDIEDNLSRINRKNIDENIEYLNKSLEVYSKYLNVPIFDLNNLYKSIHEGKYITNDDILVDPTFGTGNFFSIDGLTPSAFGQAVIANELIKTINSFYKMDIPLVETRFFLKYAHNSQK